MPQASTVKKSKQSVPSPVIADVLDLADKQGSGSPVTGENPQRHQSSSFVDAHGATVTVAEDHAIDYLGVQAEKLQAITSLLTQDQVGGMNLGGTREVLQLMANELADSVTSLIGIVAASEKGGVQ